MIRRRPLISFSRTASAVFGLIFALTSVLLVVPLLPSNHGLQEGERAPRTLQALHDTQYESEARTEAAREEASKDVSPSLLPPDPGVNQKQQAKLDDLIDGIRSVRARTDLSPQLQLDELTKLAGAEKLTSAGRTSLLALNSATFDSTANTASKALADILSKNVQPDADPTRPSTEGPNGRIEDYLASNSPSTPLELTALRDLLRAVVVPNLAVDEAGTAQRRQEAADNVSPVVVTYARGQAVVNEGQVLTASDIEALRSTGVIDDTFDYFDFGAGAVFAVGAGLLFAIFVFELQPFTPPARRRAVLVGTAVLLALVAVRIAVPAFMPDDQGRFYVFAVPVAAAAMITAAFTNLQFGAFVAVTVGFFAAFIAATTPDLAGASFVGSLESLELATVYTVSGLAGALAVHRAERLGRFALSAIVVSVASGLVLAVFWLISEPRANESLPWIALAAGVSGVLASIVTIGAFVVLSIVLRVPTRLQLMELADSSHPLLKRMQDEAPGTYHHSMMVGALAERAADGIGADALLARVGAYYHDTGKLAEPGYFIENMLDGDPSPHDALPPEKSAAIIRGHVVNGIDIARKYRLPQVVRDFIPEHHGSRLVTYFYRRAAEAGGSPPDPAGFRYDGPRPRTKESAIVMLADSCEALVRSRRDRGRPQIDALVDGIFAERLAEGQMDDCDITMRELQLVAANFKQTLRAVYHPRIEYPQPAPEEIAAVAGSGGQ